MSEHKLSEMIRLYSNGGTVLLRLADQAERMEAVVEVAKEQDETNQATGGRPEEWHKSSPAWRLHQALVAAEGDDYTTGDTSIVGTCF
ncbi:hypothetical protein LCGC14_0572910 [marine sediment metagenome]|uniref:Uncharacterized protein n=1 Tax=marine sediment metagenome TaxID=412755 RepID=A0A0F9RIT1_9ZZZZ